MLTYVNAFSFLLGALTIGLISWLTHRWELRARYRLVNNDLRDKIEIVLRLEKQTNDLIDKFHKRDLKEYKSDAFEDLYLDVFESVSKSDLFKIYGKNLPFLIKGFKAIEFLKIHSPRKIFKTYTKKWNNHRATEAHKLHGDEGVCLHVYVDLAVRNLQLNLIAIDGLKKDFNKVLKVNFMWLSPFNLW